MTGPFTPHLALPLYGLPDHSAQLGRIETQLARIESRIEALMATEVEQFEALSAKVDDLAADVREAIRILTEERANLSPEGQVAADALTAKVDTLDAQVGDADGSDGPPPPPV